ncbi:MAG: hypothetical protein ACXABU_16645, partial [Candidatus Hodarchaeales archaeon]
MTTICFKKTKIVFILVITSFSLAYSHLDINRLMGSSRSTPSLNLDPVSIFNIPDMENFQFWIEYLTEEIGIRSLTAE